MIFRCVSLFLLWTGICLSLAAGFTTCFYSRAYGDNIITNDLEPAWAALVMMVLSVCLAIAIFCANTYVKIRAVNAFEAMNGALNRENRQAIDRSCLWCIKWVAAVSLIFPTIASFVVIFLAVQLQEGNRVYSMIVHAFNTVASATFSATMWFRVYKDTEIVYLADMPVQVHPGDAAEEAIEMQQENPAEPPLAIPYLE